MNCTDVKYYLNDYSKGILLDEIREEIHDHLSFCSNCGKTFNDLVTINSEVRIKKENIQPRKEAWERAQNRSGKNINIKRIIQKFFSFVPIKNTNTHFSIHTNLKFKVPRNLSGKWFIISSIVSTIAFGIILAFVLFDSSPNTFGQVEKLSGYPIIESRVLTDQGIIKIGEKLITDSESRVRLKVGTGSEIDVQPKSEIQIIETKNLEYRLILSRGQIAARTWIAPKLFYIKTPSSVVTDLGCKYDLSVDEQASTLIQVKTGWVLMEYKNRRVLLCAETTCVSDSSKGLGVPIANEASFVFKESLNKLDFVNSSKNELAVILSEANQKDFITLFHLLKRLDNESRGMIYDRISLLFKMPQRITREGIVHGDKDMMGRLWTELGLGSISIYQYL
jgi:hypothetical protein